MIHSSTAERFKQRAELDRYGSASKVTDAVLWVFHVYHSVAIHTLLFEEIYRWHSRLARGAHAR